MSPTQRLYDDKTVSLGQAPLTASPAWHQCPEIKEGRVELNESNASQLPLQGARFDLAGRTCYPERHFPVVPAFISQVFPCTSFSEDITATPASSTRRIIAGAFIGRTDWGNLIHCELRMRCIPVCGENEVERPANDRSLFHPERDVDAISNTRMALDQEQPLGDRRFIDSIERVT